MTQTHRFQLELAGIDSVLKWLMWSRLCFDIAAATSRFVEYTPCLFADSTKLGTLTNAWRAGAYITSWLAPVGELEVRPT